MRKIVIVIFLIVIT